MLTDAFKIISRLVLQVVLLFVFFALCASTYSTADAQQAFSNFSVQDLKMLGVVNPPEKALVQAEYKGVKFLAVPDNRYSKDQLALLKYFIDRTPSVLLKYGPSAVVNGKTGFLPSLAQASGPFIYFDSSAFHTGGFWSAGSLEGVFRGFVHEMVHVYQFGKAVEIVNLQKAGEEFRSLKRQTLWEHALMNTDLIDSFTRVTGWELDKGHITIARLKNFRAEKTSNYGRVSIVEDMAETVSFVVIGDLAQLSGQRVRWTLNLLGYPSLEKVIQYTFPYSDKFKLVTMGSGVTKFDGSKKAEYNRRYGITDISHFIGKENGQFQEIVTVLKQGFSHRGWKNILSKELRLKHDIKKYLLEYQGKWRDVYIEIISYEDAKGYLIKPEKTIITVLSGYRL